MTFLDKLLNYYHLNKDDYKNLSKDISEVSLIDPFKLEGMDKTVDRIKEAIASNEKIIVYGDYDCDGITATSIMVKTFEKLSYPVSYYIPSRYIDGYGLNVENVKRMAQKGFKLIICVDNGISAFEAIDEAKKHDIDVIVIDHHEVPTGDLVKAYSIIHPLVSHLGEVVASGGYMSLFVSSALLGYYDAYLTTLAGLSIISDMMEIKSYNRDVVRLAINNLQTHRYPSLISLIDTPIINEKTFALDIAPKINAIGRMKEDKSVNLSVKFLVSEDKEEIKQLSTYIKNINEERKALTKSISDSLDESIAKEEGIVCEFDIKEGLIGLVANKLLNTYNKVSLVFTSDKNDESILKGSIRSKNGFSVTKAFSELNKYLVNGGGHALAGGLAIKKDDYVEFKKEFIELAKKHPLIEEEKQTIDISLQDISLSNYKILRSLAPFGVGFEAPTFKLANIPTKGLTFISQGKHLSTELSIDAKLLGFNIDEKSFKSKGYVDFYGSYELNYFRGSYILQFLINRYTSK